MKGYHDEYRKHIANALTDDTEQLTYQEWLEYTLADAERENMQLQARIDAAMAIPVLESRYVLEGSDYNDARDEFRAVLTGDETR